MIVYVFCFKKKNILLIKFRKIKIKGKKLKTITI